MGSRLVFSVNNSGQFIQAVRDEAKRKSMLIGNLMREAIKSGFQGRKSGFIYKLPDGKVYRASAPGEYPAIKYGPLSETFKVEVNKGGNIISVTSGAPEGVILEGESEMRKIFKAANLQEEASVVGSRPWASKAYKEVEWKIKAILGDWSGLNKLPFMSSSPGYSSRVAPSAPTIESDSGNTRGFGIPQLRR